MIRFASDEEMRAWIAFVSAAISDPDATIEETTIAADTLLGELRLRLEPEIQHEERVARFSKDWEPLENWQQFPCPDMCDSRDGQTRYNCTREKGHDGPHLCRWKGRVTAVWSVDGTGLQEP